MTLSIEITPELDLRLREEAGRLGIEPSEYVLNTLRMHLERPASTVACLSEHESRLLEEINRGLPEATWRRYHELIEMRRSEQLTDEQFAELVSISRLIELLNVRRVECLVELAHLRGTTLPKLMEQLGISPPPVI